MRSFLAAAVAATALLPLATADARNILLTNDDGLTSNALALYQALKADGHDVIVSVPCTNQSGMGAAAYFARPVAPLAAPCRNGAAAAGDPGAGAMTRAGLPAGDFFYVSGTPVMAMLYGLDIAGHKRWGRAPDLVLSGPNEGQNAGAIILSSGTIGNTQYAALRGIPAIGLSAGVNSTGNQDLNNPVSRIVAERTLEMVRELDRNAGKKPLLPAGMALNVNFPDNPAGAAWRVTRIGSYNAYVVKFSENMARDASPAMQAMARQQGAALPEWPGVTLDLNSAAPAADQTSDESVVFKTAIAISPMRAGYDFGQKPDRTVQQMLRGLFRKMGKK